MFQLTWEEAENLRLQNATSSSRSQFAVLKYGGRRYLPYVFTEHGILMLSSVLNSQRAIDVNILIMRTFSRLRHMLANSKELSGKFEQLERRVLKHDSDIRELVRDIRRLTIERSTKKYNVGFLK